MPPRGQRPTRGFSILNMKDDYEEAFETLLKAMVNQNPDIDADQFDMRLRSLISDTGGRSNFDGFSTLASEQVVQPVYSLAGDILSVAHAVFTNGDRKQAHELFESAMNESDIDILIDAIQTNNKNSPYGLIAADEDESDEKPSDETSDDENEIVDLNDDDDDQSNKLNDLKPTDTQVDISQTMANLVNEIRSPVSKEDTDEEAEKTDKPKKPMTTKEVKKTEETIEKTEKVDAALVRAAANRISMRGSNDARAKAVELRSKLSS